MDNTDITTRPFLYVDLQKSISWKETLHPRAADGKFRSIKSGSSVVTSTGKTGTVEKVTPTHYHVRHADGKKSQVAKKNAVHALDYKEHIEAAKKTKKKKAAAAKGQTTKAANKANGHGKATTIATPAATTKGKNVAPSSKATKTTKATPATKTKKDAKLVIDPKAAKKGTNKVATAAVTDASPNSKASAAAKTQTTKIKNVGKKVVDPMADKQNQALKTYSALEQDRDTTNDIDNMWNSKKVKALMKREPGKRSAEDIQKLAGEITTNNDKLARHVTLQMGKARGLNLLMQQNKIGDIGQSGKGEVINQETGYYGDLLQAARTSMYETLLRVMQGSQNPKEGSSIGAHVVSRMKQKLHSDIYNIMNEVPAPHEIRSAIGDMEAGKKHLQQTLGRNPNEQELAEHLQTTSKHFKEAPIMEHPTYDEKAGRWIATKNRIADPVERLRALSTYADQQKATSLDKNVASDGEREINAADNIRDDELTPDEAYEKKERQRELKGAIPKTLESLGLNDKEKLVFMTMFGNPSAKVKKGNLTMDETADIINNAGGYDGGQQATKAWVNKYYRSAMEKIIAARAAKHPALDDLYNNFMKSLFFNLVFKALYEYDLVKSMNSWGLSVKDLVPEYTRTAAAPNLLTLKKSLAPYEYIGSVVVVEGGGLHARITELTVPEDTMLHKSFTASLEELKKSMFPHKGKSNHEVNQKAADYVKANKEKYSSLSEAQHKAAKAKGSGLTWSEELLLKNPGSAWISWGGKRVLIAVGDGKVLYDSSNEAHREEHNKGAQEDKIDFHHEKDELEKQGLEDTPENRAGIDHGVQAFKEQMDQMKNDWKVTQAKLKQDNAHRVNNAYKLFNKDQQDEVESAEDKAYAVGKHLLNAHEKDIMPLIKDFHARVQEINSNGELSSKDKKAAIKDAAMEFAPKMQAIGKDKSNGFSHKDSMRSFAESVIAKMDDVDSREAKADLARQLGKYELARGAEEVRKKLLPEGAFMIGNPVTGKTMVVKIKNGWGTGGTKTGYTSAIAEAFDPDGGAHEELTSWGGLGRALGLPPKNIQQIIATEANTTADKPFMKQIDDKEYNKLRANTKLGLQETMTHKDFKLVDQNRDKDGNITSSTYAQDMPDGTQNTFTVDSKGYITDPVMARLVAQRKPISNVADLHDALKNAVGNRAWVTAHFGSDIHVGDALGHHVQLEYDGKGAPRVIGGVYDGYRFIDTRDIPKGAIDPATGEPIKALFKNGKLVDRTFSNLNDVPMTAGNAVMYKDGNSYKKGRIHSVEDGAYKVTDGHGHVVGMYKKEDLKPARVKGKSNSKSGQAVVKLAKTGVHRADVDSMFKAENPKDQKKLDKARELLGEALKKAGINRAFDSEGALHDKLELSDANMAKLKKVLGRSKAGKTLLDQFKSAYSKELEIHVPDNLRAQIEAEGVSVKANGTAKISVGKFEQLRDVLGGLSIDSNARKHLEEHFNRKDRRPMDERMPEILNHYDPRYVDPSSDFGKAYQAQFKDGSFIADKSKGLYGVQLQGVTHLVERGRGIVGHGMGIGKTATGVTAAMHYKATKLANGEKPKKTLIVSPAGIQSDWGKEIGGNTNSRGLYIGSTSKLKKVGADGKPMKSANGRNMFGQDGTEQEAIGAKQYLKGMKDLANEDHDFHIMSYDQFMKMRHEIANSGMYDNVIIDEIHAFKNQSGQRGKSLAETTDAFKNVWGLSGTPMENDAREIYSLIDTVTGGRHELGTRKEFTDNYLMKDKNGKIIGVKESKANKLGDILANIVQFRQGTDVQRTDGSKIAFPQLAGASSPENPNPQTDFIGDMVDRNRDHKTTEYYGTKHSVFDYEPQEHEVTAKDGSTYTVQTTTPKNLEPKMQDFYNKYRELQEQHLPEQKLKELVKAASTGYDSGTVGRGSKDRNYLTAMQKLQKYLNAPGAQNMYVPGGGSALDSDLTGEQAATKTAGKKKAEGMKPYNPATGEGHYIIDGDGHKRYFESDGKGSYARNNDGSPKLLPPLHHNNPKAQYLKQRLSTYLDTLASENARRRKDGKPELMPKVVVKSSYTTFGTDIVDNVLRDLQKEHPHLAYWANKVGDSFGTGQFTGEAEDREATKTGFRGNKKDYANNQGNLWATTVSPAGKEGVDFGNAHAMFMFDQDWNPQKMAQFTARVRRSDSADSHNSVGRSNAVRVESLHMPGTVEDFMFNGEDAKMHDITQVTTATRQAEQSPKYGDSEARIGTSRRFSRGADRKAGAKPGGTTINVNRPSAPRVTSGTKHPAVKEVAAAAEKSLKLVILI